MKKRVGVQAALGRGDPHKAPKFERVSGELWEVSPQLPPRQSFPVFRQFGGNIARAGRLAHGETRWQGVRGLGFLSVLSSVHLCKAQPVTRRHPCLHLVIIAEYPDLSARSVSSVAVNLLIFIRQQVVFFQILHEIYCTHSLGGDHFCSSFRCQPAGKKSTCSRINLQVREFTAMLPLISRV